GCPHKPSMINAVAVFTPTPRPTPKPSDVGVLVDRLLAMLVHLRHGLTHDVIAAWFGVHRSPISRSIAEIRFLLAERGCRVRDGSGSGPSPTWWPTSGSTRRR
ncbi:transposase family protein, partial [Micromonospora sp. NPDC051925]|uniref:transposase family protein n=1 Tax=Micromonospora sp. NPDC051925 TaxID=3364288 RepID=UPI0037CC4CF8